MTDRLYTTNQLAKLFGVVPTTVIDWIEAGKLDAFKTLGGHRRITHSAVLEFLKRHGLPSPPAFSDLTLKIVLLDDDSEALTLYGRILRQGLPHVETLALTSGYEALLKVGTERPQLVVFDILMPDLDGFEFCRCLRAGHPRELRLLALSGDVSTETRDRALQAGADRFLAKTDAPQQLLNVASDLLETRGARARA